MDTNVKLAKLPYYTSEVSKKKKQLENLANISNDEIAIESAINAEKKANKSVIGIANKLAFPAALSTCVLTDVIKAKVKDNKGVIKSAPPSLKIATGAASLASWLILMGSLKTANKVSQKASEKTKDENSKAAINVLGTIGGGFALSAAITSAIKKGANIFKNKMPQTVNEIASKANDFDTKFLNNSIVKKIDASIFKPLKAFGTKHPNFKKFLSKNSGLLIIGGYILSTILLGTSLAKKKTKLYQENVNNLLQAREEAMVATRDIKISETEYDKKYDREITADISGIISAAEQNDDIDKAVNETLNKLKK